MGKVKPVLITAIIIMLPLGLSVSPLSSSWALSIAIWGIVGVLLIAYHARTIMRIRVGLAKEPVSLRFPRWRSQQNIDSRVKVDAVKGRFDFEAEMLQAYESVGKVIKRFGKDSLRAGERMLSHSIRIARAKNVSQRLKATSKLAKDLEKYAGELLTQDQELFAARESLDESVLPLIDDELQRQPAEPAAIAQFKVTTQNFLRSVKGLRESTAGTKETLQDGLEGHSQDLNRAVHMASEALGRVIVNLRGLEQHGESIVRRLDTALDLVD